MGGSRTIDHNQPRRLNRVECVSKVDVIEDDGLAIGDLDRDDSGVGEVKMVERSLGLRQDRRHRPKHGAQK